MSAVTPEQVMGRALAGSGDASLDVERSDRHCSRAELRWWLRDPGARAPRDLAALDWIKRGPVLDIGCATGRHVEALRARQIAATGIDTCVTAVQLARRAGCPCRVGDVWNLTAPAGYAAITALGGNLGIAGTRARLPAFLSLLARSVQPGGMVIVSSVDWCASEEQHGSFMAAQRRAGGYPGDVRMRLRYADVVTGQVCGGVPC